MTPEFRTRVGHLRPTVEEFLFTVVRVPSSTSPEKGEIFARWFSVLDEIVEGAGVGNSSFCAEGADVWTESLASLLPAASSFCGLASTVSSGCVETSFDALELDNASEEIVASSLASLSLFSDLIVGS